MTEGTTSAAAEGGDTLTRLEQEGEIAADYLEGLLDIADLDGDIDMDVEADRAAVSIISDSAAAICRSWSAATVRCWRRSRS